VQYDEQLFKDLQMQTILQDELIRRLNLKNVQLEASMREISEQVITISSEKMILVSEIDKFQQLALNNEQTAKRLEDHIDHLN